MITRIGYSELASMGEASYVFLDLVDYQNIDQEGGR